MFFWTKSDIHFNIRMTTFSVPTYNIKNENLQRKHISLPFRELSRSVCFNLNFNKTRPHSLCKISTGISSCAFDNHALLLEKGWDQAKRFHKLFLAWNSVYQKTLPVSKSLNRSRKRRTWFQTCSAFENFLRLSANYETVRQKFSFGFLFTEKFILAEWK